MFRSQLFFAEMASSSQVCHSKRARDEYWNGGLALPDAKRFNSVSLVHDTYLIALLEKIDNMGADPNDPHAVIQFKDERLNGVMIKPKKVASQIILSSATLMVIYYISSFNSFLCFALNVVNTRIGRVCRQLVGLLHHPSMLELGQLHLSSVPLFLK